MKPVAYVDLDGRLELPREVREEARIRLGGLVELELTKKGLLLKPSKLTDVQESAEPWPEDLKRAAKAESTQPQIGSRVYRSDQEFLDALSEPDREL